MASQVSCPCPFKLGKSSVASRTTGINQTSTLEAKLRDYKIKWSNPDTKVEEEWPVMKVLGKAMTPYFTEPVLVLPPNAVPVLEKSIHGFPQSAEDMAKHIDTIDPSNMSDAEKTKEKNLLKNLTTKSVAAYSEDIIANLLSKITKERGEECIILTGYSSSSYLSILREKAKSSRVYSFEPLNAHEKILIDCYRFHIEVNQDLANFLSVLPTSSMARIDLSSSTVKAQLRTISYGRKLQDSLQSAFKRKTDLNQVELKNILEYSQLVHLLEKSSVEVDVFAYFPHQKKVLQIEIKSTSENSNVLSKLKEASGQCHRFMEFISDWHGDILPPGTTYYKVAAFPMLDKQNKIVPRPGSNIQPPCGTCLEFIWTQEEIEDLEAWMFKHIYTTQPTPGTPMGYKELVTRMGGFLSISPLQSQFFMTDMEAAAAFDQSLTGNTEGLVTAEGCSQDGQGIEMTKEAVDQLKLSGLKGLHLSSLEVFLTWNRDQLDTVLRDPSKVCLPSDYGTGKSLLEKEMARRKAEKLRREGSNDKSVFVSFAAAEDYKYKPSWMNDTVYDIATRAEFKNTGVVFYSTGDLVNLLTTPEERNDSLTVEKLIERLVTANPSYHFYCDEVPVGRDSFFQFPHLSSVWSISTGSLWLALRPTFVYSSDQSQYDTAFAAFKSTLHSNNVHIPVLNKAMRNTAIINQLAGTAQSSGWNSSSASSLPVNTVTGTVPNLVITRDYSDISSKGVKFALDTFYPTEPVVILTDRPAYVDDIVSSCRGAGYSTVVYNPGQGLTNTRDEVEMFLQSPGGVLVTTDHLFNGCQFRNIIMCLYSGGYTGRGGVMRARVSAVIVTHTGYPRLDEMRKICQTTDISSSDRCHQCCIVC